jgi:hypothetical protein
MVRTSPDPAVIPPGSPLIAETVSKTLHLDKCSFFGRYLEALIAIGD